MADQTPPQTGAGKAGTDPQGRPPTVPPVKIINQYVKDLSFENPSAPQIFDSLGQQQQAPQVTVNVDVRTATVSENRYETALVVRGETTVGDKKAFIVELSYAAIVDVEGVRRELVPWMLMVEAPRLLYPFARRIVADATRDGAFPPLMLSNFDFVELFRRRLEQVKAAQQAAGSKSDTTQPAGTA